MCTPSAQVRFVMSREACRVNFYLSQFKALTLCAIMTD